MIRPPWEATAKGEGGYIMCSCGSTLQTTQDTREHWQSGHFDYVKSTDTEFKMVSHEIIVERKELLQAFADYDETPAGRQADRLARQQVQASWWTSVDVDLPKEGTQVLVYSRRVNKAGFVEIVSPRRGIYIGDGAWSGSLMDEDQPTHWMLLPHSPSKELCDG